MYNELRLPSMIGIIFLATSLTSQATIIGDSYGVSASVSTYGNCFPGCTVSNDDEFSSISSGGVLDTSSTTSESTHASGAALANLTGLDYLPTLKVMASADLGKKASATAYAQQGFDYLGEEATSISLNLNLHGSVGNNSSGYSSNTLSAKVGILIGEQLDYYPSFGTSYYEFGLLGGSFGAGTRSLFINNGEDVDVQGNISFDLEPGDSFFVISEMNASSQNGFADAWNTLSMSFIDSTGLNATSNSSTINPVPEPSTILLLMLALFVMIRKSLPLN
jgi:hypothetical protein